MAGLRSRSEIDDRYKWKLEDIYENEDLWDNDYNRVKKLLNEILTFKGKIKNSKNLLSVLKLQDEIGQLSSKLFVYARMRRDEDNTNTMYQALADKAMRLNVEVSSVTSFIVPEILSIETDELKGIINESQELKIYEHYIDELIRYKPHILSENEERILAESGVIAESSGNIFRMLNNADMVFPVIKDENGEDVELTHGNYIKFMESRRREIRIAAFNAMYDTYKKFINTFSATTAANVKKDIFYSRIRKHNSSLEASLFDDNVPVNVYNSLIDTIHKRIDLLHRYVRLRKKLLDLDELHMYDLYVPMIKEYDKKYEYEEALNIILDGLKPLGDEYIDLLRKGFSSRWIDVYENRGKTSGAYSWGTYGTHPYVLLNYQGNLNDVFTIAHEMGHSLHTYYSNANQPYIYSEYKIFVAEVASTCNEALLINYMLEKSNDVNEKLYLLNHYLEQFKGTVYRQVMFAEFEKYTHEMAEKGESITPEILCRKYHELNEFYYGKDIVIDEGIDYEWARIPHFYTSFYVYKYATGFSAAIALSQMILKEGEPAVLRYKEFLKSGNSDYPLNILKKAGVDLTTPQPILDALDVFEKLLIELEQIIT